MRKLNLVIRFIFLLIGIDHGYSLYKLFNSGEHEGIEKSLLVLFRISMIIFFLALGIRKTNYFTKKTNDESDK